MDKIKRCVNFVFSNYKNHNFNILASLYRGDLLKYYGFSDDIVCSAYLLDLVNIGIFDEKEIAWMFGGTVSSNLLICNIDYSSSDKVLLRYFDGLNDKLKGFACADLFVKYLYGEVSIDNFKRVLGIISEDYVSNIFNMCVREVFGENYFKRDGNLSNLRKVFTSSSPYIILVSDNAGEMDYADILRELFDNSFKLRIGGNSSLDDGVRNKLISYAFDGTELYQMLNDKKVFMIDDRIYDRFLWFNILVNREELKYEDINNFIENSLKVMTDNIIFSGISLFEGREDFFRGIPDDIKVIFDEEEPSEMSMSVVNSFIPIMSKQYLLNLKNKISR